MENASHTRVFVRDYITFCSLSLSLFLFEFGIRFVLFPLNFRLQIDMLYSVVAASSLIFRAVVR